MTARPLAVLQRDVVTPVTLVLALIVGVSGVMLFFHVQPGLVRGAHEWLGLAFFVAAGLHLLRHSGPALAYLRRPLGRAGYALTAVLAAALLVATAQGGASPQQAAIGRLLAQPLTVSAPALGLDVDAAIVRLQALGVEAEAADSLRSLAARSGQSPMAFLAALTRTAGD